MDPWTIAGLFAIGSSLLSAFSSQKVSPPQSASDKFYADMVDRFRKVRDLREANTQSVAWLTGQTVAQVRATVKPWDRTKFVATHQAELDARAEAQREYTEQHEGESGYPEIVKQEAKTQTKTPSYNTVGQKEVGSKKGDKDPMRTPVIMGNPYGGNR